MERDFNITAQCVPGKHYMVDTSKKLDIIERMIDKGLYFTINRARQYGKTTTFYLLEKRLKEKYLIIQLSFEGQGDGAFENEANFCRMFIGIFADAARLAGVELGGALSAWIESKPKNIAELGKSISSFCESYSKPVVVMIDEVDKTSNNKIFLYFLGMLRNKYILRGSGKDTTFQSAILAGVHDIKNLKLKIHGSDAAGERSFNSPWNIASDFKVDMSFNPDEIATMLVDYENDWHTGMDIAEISNLIYKYTSGYPFLVSKLCKLIDEDLDRDWTLGGVERAVKILLEDKNTLFDDLFKNIENNKNLYNLIFEIMIEGKEIPFSSDNPDVGLGEMYGFFVNRDGKVAIANELFELRISNYLASKTATDIKIRNMVLKEDIVENGKFDMQLCLKKFGWHYHELFNKNDEAFLESHGRILFITYLKPLINGQGFYHIETQTRNMRRMDLTVDYGKRQFIVELKLWRGEKRHEDAYRQLWEYLEAKGFNEGYLLTFDFRKQDRIEKYEWIEYNGKKIFDVIV